MSRHAVDNTPADAAAPHPVAVARKELHLSREGLAFKAHVSVKTIERIEHGLIQRPHRLTRRAIAAVLERDPTDLWPDLEVAA